MDYDILIATYKRKDLLEVLLNSIPKGIADIFIYFDNNDIENYLYFRKSKDYICILLPEQKYCQWINNYHCSRSSKKGVIVLNDDMKMEEGAIQNLIKCFEEKYPDTDGLVGMNQYLIPTGSKCAAWLIGKKFSERFLDREAMYPGYIGRFADTELMQTAIVLNKFYWCEEAKIHHYQPEAIDFKDSFVLDEARKSQETTQDKDAKLYIERQKDNLFLERVTSNMQYDICIGTYKRKDLLKILLNSIPKRVADIFIYFDIYDKENYEYFKNIYKCILFPNHEDGCLEAFNYHAREVLRNNKKGAIFLNDDMEIEPGAIEALIKCFEEKFPDTDGLVGMNQYLIPTGSKCAAWLAGRRFISRFPNGEILYPEYHGRFSDSELMLVASDLNKFYWCEEAKIKHWQPDSVGQQAFTPDEARLSTEKYHNEDAKLYLERCPKGKHMHRLIAPS